jgi:hypothetical protein
MDRLKNLVNDINPEQIEKSLGGVTWPIGKDDLVRVLKQNNVPDGIVSKVEGTNASQFENKSDLLSKIGL